MNYYIQGNAANADKIKAAFDKLGFDVIGFDMCNDNILFFTYELEGGGKVISTTNANFYTANIIKTHPDYKELELPKPHYDIANFQPKQWVLVRDDDEWEWALTRFSHLSYGSASLFVCINGASFQQCIPFQGNEKLLGTTDMPSEEFINW